MNDQLTEAWRRMEATALLHLICADLGWAGWRASGPYLQGPCPDQTESKRCWEDPQGAYVYTNDKGWPPVVCCNHTNTCASKKSLFAWLAEHLGSRRAAAELVKRRAGIHGQVPIMQRAVWPQARRLVVRRQSRG